MISISYDFHIHSCLSPCGDDESVPADIAGMAFVKGLDFFALTDHNSSKNCPAAEKAAEYYGIGFLPGMELTTEEEVHVVFLFPSVDRAMEFDSFVGKRLIPVKNRPEIFGRQLIIDENDNIIGEEENLLINATDIPFCETHALSLKFGGVAVPAHIDKGSNSLLANLGFIPPGSQFKTAELKNYGRADELKNQHGYLKGCRIITDSDAHRLEDISEPVNFLHVEDKTPEAVIKALKNPTFMF